MAETPLDQWKPTGTPIHPYDLYELISGLPVQLRKFNKVDDCPDAIDEADWIRNRHKVGSVIDVAGKLFFETTTITPVTKAFA